MAAPDMYRVLLRRQMLNSTFQPVSTTAIHGSTPSMCGDKLRGLDVFHGFQGTFCMLSMSV